MFEVFVIVDYFQCAWAYVMECYLNIYFVYNAGHQGVHHSDQLLLYLHYTILL